MSYPFCCLLPLQEIAEVDGQVAAKQERMRLLEAELASLHGTELVVLAGAVWGVGGCLHGVGGAGAGARASRWA